MALKYTKFLQFRTILALKDGDGNTAVSIKAKEALVRRSAFPKPPPNFIEPPIISCGIVHIKITKETIAQVLMTQSKTKAPGQDKINFKILQMI